LPLSRLIDQFEAKVVLCASDGELSCLLEDVTRELGFFYFALLHHASLRMGAASLVRIDNYPEGWKQELLAERFMEDDPIHLACTRINSGFRWTDLEQLVAISSRHSHILERSWAFGMGDGFTVPANVPGEPGGSCSFATRRGVPCPLERLLYAELIGAHAFAAARRIHHYPAAGIHPRLSRRERECLHLVAAGKTDWEIGRILGISAETARQYVKRLRAAYDVASRTQLAVHGLRDAWISFDDAIPPGGGMA
jgi:LuxR family quorum-sensing system transcriptional regulator CciR